VLNPSTTPRLFAARKDVLRIMDEHTLALAKASTDVVLFVITINPLLSGIGEDVPPTAMRRPVPPEAAPAAAKATATATQAATETASEAAPAATKATATATQAATETAEEIGTAIGKAVSGNMTGKMAAIVERVTGLRLPQADAVKATEAAVQVWLRTGPQVRLPDGSIVVTSVKEGLRQPVLVVRPDGSAFRALADIFVNKETWEFMLSNVTPSL
jgi:hypothetical protein